MKIYDLVYFDRLNEGAVIQTGKNRRRTFSVSVVLGVAGTLLLTARELSIGLTGAGCVILSLFGFFISFASGVPVFFDKRPARKYQRQNLLVFRSLTAKLATMGTLMAIISMIFTATLSMISPLETTQKDKVRPDLVLSFLITCAILLHDSTTP